MTPAVKRLIGVSTGLAFIIGTVFVMSTLVFPEVDKLQELRGEREALDVLLVKETETVEIVKGVVAEFGGITNVQESLTLALPLKEDVPGIINQVYGISKISGVLIDSIGLQLLPITPVGQNSALRPFGTIRITLSIKGTYEQIKIYLDGLETNIRIMDIESVGLQSETESEVLDYSVILKTYYQD